MANLVHIALSEKNHANPSTYTNLQVNNNPNSKEVGNCRKILFSDVVVRPGRRVFWGRKWTVKDVTFASLLLGIHVLSLFAPFHFNWAAFWVSSVLSIVSGAFGITLCFHRNLAHQSFKLPKWLEYFFAYCGTHAGQSDPIYWVSAHRYHHQFADTERDMHSPNEGFWFSHMGWLFDSNYMYEKSGGRKNVEDLKKQPFYRFLAKTYPFHLIALGALLYAWGGFPFLVWGTGVRITLTLQTTFLVNSAAHIWGKRAWKTRDLSKNNSIVALLTFGEGWHNNHHAFEYSARHGLEWWQLDVTWYIVSLLQAAGLAMDVKVPTKIQRENMALNSECKND